MRAAPLFAVLTLALTAACADRDPEPPPRPPIILITFEGLRAASVGVGHTPSYDDFAAEADWAGRGVAASSRAVVSGASLATGLNPWRHRVLTSGDRLSSHLITLAETLSALGYHTSGYFSGSLNSPAGFQQGFDFFRTLHRGRGARSHLRALQGGPELVWLHLQHPSPPWVRRDWLFPDGKVPPWVPRRITAEELEPYRGSGAVPSPEERRRFEALYQNNVALADVLLGRFLEDLRNSGHWEEVVVAVTSTHGQELPGEAGVSDGGLSPRMLEVPWAIRLPRGAAPGSAESRMTEGAPAFGDRVSTTRLFATLVEAAGGRVPPGVAPSLFRPGDRGTLSELYGHRGENLFSWLRGDLQLLWRLPLPVPGRPGAVEGTGAEPSPARFEASPLTGRRDGRRLLRWTSDGAETVDDPPRADRMTEELRRRWTTFLPVESASPMLYSLPPRAGGETGP